MNDVQRGAASSGPRKGVGVMFGGPREVAVERFKVGFRALLSDLRKQGAFARSSWQCCMSCGYAAVPKEHVGDIVFTHKQNTDSFVEGAREYIRGGAVRGYKPVSERKPSDIYPGHFVTFGRTGDGSESDFEAKVQALGARIVALAEKHGLQTEWDGDTGTKVWVGVKPLPTPEEKAAAEAAAYEQHVLSFLGIESN